MGTRLGSGLHKIFGMPCSMYSSLLVEGAGSAHCWNKQTTVAQPAAGLKEGYPSVGKNVFKKTKKVSPLNESCKS